MFTNIVLGAQTLGYASTLRKEEQNSRWDGFASSYNLEFISAYELACPEYDVLRMDRTEAFTPVAAGDEEGKMDF